MERIFSETDLKRELLEFELEEKLTILLGFSSSFNIKNNLNTLLISAQSNIQEPTRIVEEVKIELIELKENRQKIYEILCAVSKERTLEETEQLLNKVDKILAIFEAKKLKNDLFDNRNSTSIFKEEIDDLIKKIDDKISNIELEEDDNSFYKEKMNMLLDTDEESS
ncbi:hypothetical protein EOM09_08265, partial [bacterium]|nr:hypothetical protein [bacterium]